MTKPDTPRRRRPPEAPAAAAEPVPPAPLPGRGGAFRRLDDGRLVPEDGAGRSAEETTP